jgi:hypothetical protein
MAVEMIGGQMRRGNDGRSDFTGAADFAQGERRDARDPVAAAIAHRSSQGFTGYLSRS